VVHRLDDSSAQDAEQLIAKLAEAAHDAR
jgi:hypothetical protein